MAITTSNAAQFWFLLRSTLLFMLYMTCTFFASEAWNNGFLVGTQGDIEVYVRGSDNLEGLITDWGSFLQVLPVLITIPLSAVLALAHADARRESRGERLVCDGYLFTAASEGPGYMYGNLIFVVILSLLDLGWDIEKTRSYLCTNVIIAVLAACFVVWADYKLRKVREIHDADPRNLTQPYSPVLGTWRRMLENICGQAAWTVAISWTYTLFLVAYEFDNTDDIVHEEDWNSDSTDVVVGVFSFFAVLFPVWRTHLFTKKWALLRNLQAGRATSDEPQDSDTKPQVKLVASNEDAASGTQESASAPQDSAAKTSAFSESWPLCYSCVSQFARAMHGIMLLRFLQDNSSVLRQGLRGTIGTDTDHDNTVGDLYAFWAVMFVISLTVLLIPKLIKWACDERYDQEKLQKLEDTQYRSRFFWTTLAGRLDVDWKLTVGFVFGQCSKALVIQYVQPDSAVRWFMLAMATTAGVYACADLFARMDVWLTDFTGTIPEDVSCFELEPLNHLALKRENAELLFRLQQLEEFLASVDGFETKSKADMRKSTRKEIPPDEGTSKKVVYDTDHSHGYA
eukprot:TRINITY_DN1082_c0_g1_i1.p1 TRINITY_DN1082_c0_g1~~TRINITY_DN1082_c0_g1_i1.p1  ORF type:complete len:569 (+),score=112.79 TRINITY_DN1082_c0_g1_i1:219-1925(+)